MTFLVTWCHWQHYQLLVIPMALEIAPLHCLVNIIKKRSNMTYLGHVMPQAALLASHDATCIVNGTTAFIKSRQPKWGATWLSDHGMPLALVLASHYTKSIKNAIITFLRTRQFTKDATCLFGHLMPLALASGWNDGNNIINGTITFLMLRQLKRNTMTFWSYNATDMGIKWYQWHCQWYKTLMPAPVLALALKVIYYL